MNEMQQHHVHRIEVRAVHVVLDLSQAVRIAFP